MPKFERHPLVYPPRGASMRQLRRYANGRWRLPDGQPALVFVEKLYGTNDAIIHIANCDCKMPSECPLGVALDYTSDRYDATEINRRPQTRNARRR